MMKTSIIIKWIIIYFFLKRSRIITYKHTANIIKLRKNYIIKKRIFNTFFSDWWTIDSRTSKDTIRILASFSPWWKYLSCSRTQWTWPSKAVKHHDGSLIVIVYYKFSYLISCYSFNVTWNSATAKERYIF